MATERGRYYMSNTGTYAICPFWQTEYRTRIICEGLDQGCETNVAFRLKEDFAAWKDKYCESYGYSKCPYYKAILNNNYKE